MATDITIGQVLMLREEFDYIAHETEASSGAGTRVLLAVTIDGLLERAQQW